MWQSFTVKNFRPFRELTLQPLGRVNLIAGKNNTGKTALLEAVHLYSNPWNCILPLLLNEARGIERPNMDAWNVASWAFFDRDTAHPIELTGKDMEGAKRTLQVRLIDAVTANAPEYASLAKEFTTRFRADIWDAVSPRLVLDYWAAEGEKATGVAVLSSTAGMSSLGFQAEVPRPSLFVACKEQPSGTALNHYVDDPNELFSEMEAAGRQEEVLKTLRLLEPRLRKLSLLLLSGKTMIHAHLDGIRRPTPVAFMGEGLRRLLFFALLITNRPGGSVLIDEIENGLHYSVMKDVWKATADAARRADVQVFATTHSYECIVAAHEAFTANGPYDLRLFRLDRIGEEIKVAAYDQDVLGYATEMNHEVR